MNANCSLEYSSAEIPSNEPDCYIIGIIIRAQLMRHRSRFRWSVRPVAGVTSCSSSVCTVAITDCCFVRESTWQGHAALSAVHVGWETINN